MAGDGQPALRASVQGTRLVAICGLSNDPYIADEAIGRGRHVDVARYFRRHGIGTQMIEFIVTKARGRFTTSRLKTDSNTASDFYEKLGLRKTAHESASHILPMASDHIV